MAFAAEFQDFISAFSAVHGALGSKDDRDAKREDRAWNRQSREWAVEDRGHVASDRANALEDRELINEDRRSQIRARDTATNEKANPNADILGAAGRKYGVEVPVTDMNTGPGAALPNVQAPAYAGAFNVAAASQSIADIESSGGDYNATGRWVTRKSGKKDRAYGKYQVMGDNVGPWTEKYVGQRMTADAFLADPAAQEAVFAGEFGSYVERYGTVGDAASAWFTGRPISAESGAAKDANGTSGNVYVDRFVNGYNAYAADGIGAAPDAQGAIEDQFVVPEGGDVDGLTGDGTQGQDDLGVNDEDYLIYMDEKAGVNPITAKAKSAVREGQAWLANTFGLNQEGAVDDGTEDTTIDSRVDAKLAGVGAAPADLMEQIGAMAEQAAGHSLTDGEKVVHAMGFVYEYNLQHGDAEKAQAMAGAMLQHQNVLWQQFASVAAAAASEGDIDGATEAAARAYAQVPDGRAVKFSKDGENYKMTYTDETTGEVISDTVMSPSQIGATVMRMATPAQFDAFLDAAAGVKSDGDPNALAKAVGGGVTPPGNAPPAAAEGAVDVGTDTGVGAMPAPASTRPVYDTEAVQSMPEKDRPIYDKWYADQLKIWEDGETAAKEKADEEEEANALPGAYSHEAMKAAEAGVATAWEVAIAPGDGEEPMPEADLQFLQQNAPGIRAAASTVMLQGGNIMMTPELALESILNMTFIAPFDLENPPAPVWSAKPNTVDPKMMDIDFVQSDEFVVPGVTMPVEVYEYVKQLHDNKFNKAAAEFGAAGAMAAERAAVDAAETQRQETQYNEVAVPALEALPEQAEAGITAPEVGALPITGPASGTMMDVAPQQPYPAPPAPTPAPAPAEDAGLDPATFARVLQAARAGEQIPDQVLNMLSEAQILELIRVTEGQ